MHVLELVPVPARIETEVPYEAELVGSQHVNRERPAVHDEFVRVIAFPYPDEESRYEMHDG
jgi:hypothetical protein